jgi:hypothetical protein
MHGQIDPELLSLRRLCRVGIDAHDLPRADLFEKDPRQQPIAASEIEATSFGQSRGDQMTDFDRAPLRRRGLKRIVTQKADQKVAPQ